MKIQGGKNFFPYRIGKVEFKFRLFEIVGEKFVADPFVGDNKRFEKIPEPRDCVVTLRDFDNFARSHEFGKLFVIQIFEIVG